MSELDLQAAIVGLLRLAVAEREERLDRDALPKRTEVLLYDAGLSYAQIAEATGKKQDTVRKTIQRAETTKDKR